MSENFGMTRRTMFIDSHAKNVFALIIYEMGSGELIRTTRPTKTQLRRNNFGKQVNYIGDGLGNTLARIITRLSAYLQTCPKNSVNQASV